jgi:hypothetical protein
MCVIFGLHLLFGVSLAERALIRRLSRLRVACLEFTVVPSFHGGTKSRTLNVYYWRMEPATQIQTRTHARINIHVSKCSSFKNNIHVLGYSKRCVLQPVGRMSVQRHRRLAAFTLPNWGTRKYGCVSQSRHFTPTI